MFLPPMLCIQFSICCLIPSLHGSIWWSTTFWSLSTNWIIMWINSTILSPATNPINVPQWFSLLAFLVSAVATNRFKAVSLNKTYSLYTAKGLWWLGRFRAHSNRKKPSSPHQRCPDLHVLMDSRKCGNCLEFCNLIWFDLITAPFTR